MWCIDCWGNPDCYTCGGTGGAGDGLTATQRQQLRELEAEEAALALLDPGDEDDDTEEEETEEGLPPEPTDERAVFVSSIWDGVRMLSRGFPKVVWTEVASC